MRRRLICASLCFAFVAADAEIPAPSGAQIQRFRRDLAYLEKTFVDDQRKGDQFGDHFWRESKRIAAVDGPEIIAAIMERARRWTDEEGLVYVPLVSVLPRARSLAILRAYEHSARESDRVWAHEFIVEFDMPDTKTAAKHYSK